jgi:hypothetical protein
MTQKSFTREPPKTPKTKAELREMLAEAVRNTTPQPKRSRRPREVVAKGRVHTPE